MGLETMDPATAFDPYDKTWMDDPYPLYRRLREWAPVAWSPRARAWLVTGYAEVKQVLRDRQAAPNDLAAWVRALSIRANKPLESLLRALDAILFFQHGPDHATARRFLAQVLNARPLDGLIPDMQAVAQELLSKVHTEGAIDAVADYADLMPYYVMGRVLGIEKEEIQLIAREMNGFLVVFNRGCSLRDLEQYDLRMKICLDLLEKIIRMRRKNPKDDGISRLVVNGENEKLPDSELASRCMFLLLTGSETSATFVGNAVRLLIENPEQQALLRTGHVSMAQAVDEMLRFESPVQQTMRVVSVDYELGGHQIPAGEHMLLIISAANRDPARFADPEQLVLTRDASAQLAFAAGAHQCLGERLARMESGVAVQAFLELPKMKLTDTKHNWWASHNLRRLEGLKIEPA
jgi:pimeloyl-[acyl-carrier protein] synthase